MKQKTLFPILTLALIFVICGFTSTRSSSIPKSTNETTGSSKDQTNETKAVNTTYTLRALTNSTTAVEMSVTESAGTVTILTSNSTPTTSDKIYIILSTDFSFASDFTCSIAPDQKTWLVPFNGDAPIQIADLGSGGGGGGSTTCYKFYCPCQDACPCSNVCNPGDPIIVNGRYCGTCTQTTGAEVCPTGCCAKWCKVACSGGSVIASTYAGSAYIVRASTLVLNGTTY